MAVGRGQGERARAQLLRVRTLHLLLALAPRLARIAESLRERIVIDLELRDVTVLRNEREEFLEDVYVFSPLNETIFIGER